MWAAGCFYRDCRGRLLQCRSETLKCRRGSCPMCRQRESFYFFCQFRREILGLRMIEDERGLRFVYFFKQCAESVRIELSVGHEPDRHKTGF